MMCCFLLLLTLTSCVCEPTFVVKVTQSSYQAEKNHDVTLEWTFTNTQGSTDSLIVYCRLFRKNQNQKVVYHLHKGDEEFQDEEFSGRVQCDRDVLREGRVRLHVSRLRTEDSGRYDCWVLTGNERASDSCHLDVTEAVDEPGSERPGPGPEPEPEPETPEPRPGRERPGPGSWGHIAAYVVPPVAVSVFLVVSLLYFKLRLRMCKFRRENITTAAETQSLSKLQSIRSKSKNQETEPGLTLDQMLVET